MRPTPLLADRLTAAGAFEALPRVRQALSGRTMLRVAVEPIRSAEASDLPDALRERLLERVRVELGLD